MCEILDAGLDTPEEGKPLTPKDLKAPVELNFKCHKIHRQAVAAKIRGLHVLCHSRQHCEQFSYYLCG